MLASYDSSQDVLLGALSECYKQVQVGTLIGEMRRD
jgi:hypothetical protein